MAIVDEWWGEIDPINAKEAPFITCAELFVKKGIAGDSEFAKKILHKSIDKRAIVVTYDQFN